MNNIDAEICHAGDPPFMMVAEIRHEIVEGRHTFTSDDIFGLCVASRDFETAKRQLTPVIQELFRHNHSLDCTVKLVGKGMPDGKNTDEPRYAVVAA